MYALAALLPLLPAKQRETSAQDWMTTDCRDCLPGSALRRTLSHNPHRSGASFRHSETTGLPDKRGTPYWADNNDEDTSP